MRPFSCFFPFFGDSQPSYDDFIFIFFNLFFSSLRVSLLFATLEASNRKKHRPLWMDGWMGEFLLLTFSSQQHHRLEMNTSCGNDRNVRECIETTTRVFFYRQIQRKFLTRQRKVKKENTSPTTHRGRAGRSMATSARVDVRQRGHRERIGDRSQRRYRRRSTQV